MEMPGRKHAGATWTEKASDYRFSVRADDASSGAPSSIVCEPLTDDPVAASCGAFAVELQPGTSLDEAHAIARVMQRRVKGFCRLVRHGAGTGRDKG